MDDDALLLWFASAKLPDAYEIGQHVVVTDGAKNHAYLRARIAEGCGSMVQSGVMARLRVLWKMFGETPQEGN